MAYKELASRMLFVKQFLGLNHLAVSNNRKLKIKEK